MADSKHTQPAPAGKADNAELLISEMISTFENLSQCLKQIQLSWQEAGEIRNEIIYLQAADRWMADTKAGILYVRKLVNARQRKLANAKH